MKYVKRNESDYVINVEINLFGSGYNVVPKEIDPWNKYDIADIQVYAQEHPEMEVVWNEEQEVYVPIEV